MPAPHDPRIRPGRPESAATGVDPHAEVAAPSQGTVGGPGTEGDTGIHGDGGPTGTGDAPGPAGTVRGPGPTGIDGDAVLERPAFGDATVDPPPPPSIDARTAVDPAPPPAAAPAILPVVEVHALDWAAIRAAVDARSIRSRMRATVEAMEALLDQDRGPGLLFDGDRTHAGDRVIKVSATDDSSPLWIVGDLHGDLLALEAALAHMREHATTDASAAPRIIFLGDFIDDGGFALELLLRVFELIVEAPGRVCVIAGNHDEALAYAGGRFTSSVSPSDFADLLNADLADEWSVRAGKLAIRLTAHVPRALFFPDGLLVAHGGFPLVDLHPALAASGDWNDPACLTDFVWSRAHPKARRKMPNRFSRGSQFGYEDFADFCALSARLGRPVTHMARGHDHVEPRYAIYPAYQAHPVLTTVALSRRLDRERLGPYARTPTLARVVTGCLPQVFQLYPPAELVNELFPQPEQDEGPMAVVAGVGGEVQP